MEKINLVLSGSGTVFYVHIGGVEALLKRFQIKELVGTSGGSIVASMLACGYKINDIKIICNEINLKNNADWSFNPFYRFGLVNGDKILITLKKYLNYTFSEAFNLSGIPLTVIVTNAITGEAIYYNTKLTPNKKIYEVVRASLSIPFLFKYVLIDNIVCIDGGLVNNFAVDLFQEKNTYGLRILSKVNQIKPLKEYNLDIRNIGDLIKLINPLFWNNIIQATKEYLGQVINIVLNNLEQKHIEDSVYSQIINLKTDKDSLSFEHTNKDIITMYEQGYNSVEDFFNSARS